MSLEPYVIEQTKPRRTFLRYFSRLLNDRIVMLTDEVNNTTASLVVAQLLYLKGRILPKISICTLTALVVL